MTESFAWFLKDKIRKGKDSKHKEPPIYTKTIIWRKTRYILIDKTWTQNWVHKSEAQFK